MVLVPPVSLIEKKGLDSFVWLHTDVGLVDEPRHSAAKLSHHYVIHVGLDGSKRTVFIVCVY